LSNYIKGVKLTGPRTKRDEAEARRAQAFINTAKVQMNPEKIHAFYRWLAYDADFSPLVEQLELLSRCSDLVTREEVVKYAEQFADLKQKARQFIEQRIEPAAETTSSSPRI